MPFLLLALLVDSREQLVNRLRLGAAQRLP
ncbi:MAG: hypothetical protein ACJARY_001675 [Candidatus Azotimanducaceae bacterium]|jgi:hypothetical protein